MGSGLNRKAPLAAAAVVVVFNLATLGAAWANRSGEPQAVLRLTERELSLPPREAENTALSLRLRWVDPELLRAGPGWFDRRKLEELGFDCRPAVATGNRAHYQGQIPRAAFAVLEYEGEAWRRYLAEPAFPPRSGQRRVDPRQAEREPARRANGSHLVLVDVGPDAASLRSRYPDRATHVVVPAVVDLVFVEEEGLPPYLEGRVGTVLPAEVNVPRPYRRLLESLQPEARRGLPAAEDAGAGAPRPPRYVATVKWGRRLEPWLAGVEPIERPGADR